MADPLTLGLLVVGSLFLALWYGARGLHDQNQQRHIVRELLQMPSSDDKKPANQQPLPSANLPARLTRDLPVKIDEQWVERRVLENLDLFRGTSGLLEAFLFTLRDRYHSRWELEILQRVEQKLAAQVRVMEAGADHAAMRRTLRERTETKILETRTRHEQARQDYERTQAGAPHSQGLAATEAENRLLEAALRNRELKRRLEKEDRKPRGPDEELEEVRERVRRDEERKFAEDQARTAGRVRRREQLVSDMNAKIATIRADRTLSEEDKTDLIEEVKDEYAQILGRDL